MFLIIGSIDHRIFCCWMVKESGKRFCPIHRDKKEADPPFHKPAGFILNARKPQAPNHISGFEIKNGHFLRGARKKLLARPVEEDEENPRKWSREMFDFHSRELEIADLIPPRTLERQTVCLQVLRESTAV